MLGEGRFLAVVPARGGSKSIPRKNVRPLAGRPLLLYTLDQAAAVSELDCTVVSTDDAEIAAVAVGAGARVLDRPKQLATDTAPTEWALLNALDQLEIEGSRFDFVVVLEPTSPFRTSESIRRCMSRIVACDAPSLMTVTETRSNIGRLEGGKFRPLISGAPRRRQLRQPFFVESSTIYIARVPFLRATGSLVADDWVAEIVPDEEGVDINSPFDFVLAEALMRARTENEPSV